MNLGFIGTGKIASSVITGISNSKISYKKIIISPRNIKIAKNLTFPEINAKLLFFYYLRHICIKDIKIKI